MKRYFWIAAAVILADQAAKLWARSLPGSIPFIPGVIGITPCRNTGVAFSLLSGVPWLTGILSMLILLLGWLLLRGYRLGGLASVSAMLVCGGALGNAIDRVFLGAVTDFIEIQLFPFAIFNVADIAVCMGCALMALSLFICPASWQRKERGHAE